ncbi:cold-inducible protein YdjO-related protein [Bacillus xiapuensis]|uniref:cold-inducible protein YdjO-related protein n=1 Tax=Bacillus xiapuensis TaxID=2014075 RepID=UPI000C24B9E4|nr:cold-inducible protein YdjO-related protein [Bacillus xiapuensis]
MSFYNNRRKEPLPSENVDTWECPEEDCNGWMRKDFAAETPPPCPFCGAQMISGTRYIPPLKNTSLHKD